MAAPGWRCLLAPVYTDWRLAAAAAAAGGGGGSRRRRGESADLATLDDL